MIIIPSPRETKRDVTVASLPELASFWKTFSIKIQKQEMFKVSLVRQPIELDLFPWHPEVTLPMSSVGNTLQIGLLCLKCLILIIILFPHKD